MIQLEDDFALLIKYPFWVILRCFTLFKFRRIKISTLALAEVATTAIENIIMRLELITLSCMEILSKSFLQSSKKPNLKANKIFCKHIKNVVCPLIFRSKVFYLLLYLEIFFGRYFSSSIVSYVCSILHYDASWREPGDLH